MAPSGASEPVQKITDSPKVLELLDASYRPPEKELLEPLKKRLPQAMLVGNAFGRDARGWEEMFGPASLPGSQ